MGAEVYQKAVFEHLCLDCSRVWSFIFFTCERTLSATADEGTILIPEAMMSVYPLPAPIYEMTLTTAALFAFVVFCSK